MCNRDASTAPQEINNRLAREKSFGSNLLMIHTYIVYISMKFPNHRQIG